MRKRLLLFLVVIVFGLFVTACSNDTKNSEQASDQAKVETEQFTEENSQSSESSLDKQESAPAEKAENGGSESDTASQPNEGMESDRKIIYTANLRIEVNDYQATVDSIDTAVADRGGYIVESTMHEGSEDGTTTGQVTARVPQEEFEDFVQTVEDGSNRVIESSTSGRDVTEEYVDLESRLKSKQVVEERLKSFMEEAEATEDLLKISDDLATVQQEIEEITGRMKYLENKIDLATVTIHIEENNVSLSNKEDLNTWEKTKEQFMRSINFMLSALSGLVVFFAGSSPVLLILALIGTGAFWIIKRRKKDEQ